jgi:hypothetical protein
VAGDADTTEQGRAFVQVGLDRLRVSTEGQGCNGSGAKKRGGQFHDGLAWIVAESDCTKMRHSLPQTFNFTMAGPAFPG